MDSTAMPNPGESVCPEIRLPVAPDRRQQDRIITKLPMKILAVDSYPVFYPAECTNLSRGGIGFVTAARLEVGKVIEFEFVQVDEPVLYWVRILFRDNNCYGGYYVNDDGTDIRRGN